MFHFLQPEIMQRRRKKRKRRIAKGTWRTWSSMTSTMMKSTNSKKWWSSSSQSIGAMPTGGFECCLKCCLSILFGGRWCKTDAYLAPRTVDSVDTYNYTSFFGFLVPWIIDIIDPLVDFLILPYRLSYPSFLRLRSS